MEEKVLARIQELMAAESPTVRREVELTNVPVIASQVERFRRRHEYWGLKVKELQVPQIARAPATASNATSTR